MAGLNKIGFVATVAALSALNGGPAFAQGAGKDDRKGRPIDWNALPQDGGGDFQPWSKGKPVDEQAAPAPAPSGMEAPLSQVRNPLREGGERISAPTEKVSTGRREVRRLVAVSLKGDRDSNPLNPFERLAEQIRKFLERGSEIYLKEAAYLLPEALVLANSTRRKAATAYESEMPQQEMYLEVLEDAIEALALDQLAHGRIGVFKKLLEILMGIKKERNKKDYYDDEEDDDEEPSSKENSLRLRRDEEEVRTFEVDVSTSYKTDPNEIDAANEIISLLGIDKRNAEHAEIELPKTLTASQIEELRKWINAYPIGKKKDNSRKISPKKARYDALREEREAAKAPRLERRKIEMLQGRIRDMMKDIGIEIGYIKRCRGWKPKEVKHMTHEEKWELKNYFDRLNDELNSDGQPQKTLKKLEDICMDMHYRLYGVVLSEKELYGNLAKKEGNPYENALTVPPRRSKKIVCEFDIEGEEQDRRAERENYGDDDEGMEDWVDEWEEVGGEDDSDRDGYDRRRKSNAHRRRDTYEEESDAGENIYANLEYASSGDWLRNSKDGGSESDRHDCKSKEEWFKEVGEPKRTNALEKKPEYEKSQETAQVDLFDKNYWPRYFAKLAETATDGNASPEFIRNRLQEIRLELYDRIPDVFKFESTYEIIYDKQSVPRKVRTGADKKRPRTPTKQDWEQSVGVYIPENIPTDEAKLRSLYGEVIVKTEATKSYKGAPSKKAKAYKAKQGRKGLQHESSLLASIRRKANIEARAEHRNAVNHHGNGIPLPSYYTGDKPVFGTHIRNESDRKRNQRFERRDARRRDQEREENRRIDEELVERLKSTY